MRRSTPATVLLLLYLSFMATSYQLERLRLLCLQTMCEAVELRNATIIERSLTVSRSTSRTACAGLSIIRSGPDPDLVLVRGRLAVPNRLANRGLYVVDSISK